MDSTDMDHQTVHQCKSCPWRVDCDPEHDIPNGYSTDRHCQLRNTIAQDLRISRILNIMACHYAPVGEEFPCAGWLYNQLGVGNNITVRLAIGRGQLPIPEVDGEQHETFDDTLPIGAHR